MQDALLNFIDKHKGEAVVVCGTGPSAWKYGESPVMREALNKLPIIGINRAFNVGLKLTYQLSLDSIWLVLRNKRKEAQHDYRRLESAFVLWKKKAGPAGMRWSLEDFVAAYGKHFDLDVELQSYFRLLSPNVPFTRFVPESLFRTCPYHAIPFRRLTTTPSRKYEGGLWHMANSAHSAIHLAALMGANAIFLVGVDMAPPDRANRVWETVKYSRDGVMKGFSILKSAFQMIKIMNLNPNAPLKIFGRVKSESEALHVLKAHTRSQNGSLKP